MEILRRSAATTGLLLLASFVIATAPPQPSFQGLGSLAGAVPGSVAGGISADGQVVVGGCASGATCTEAWRWTQVGGIQGLGVLSGQTKSFATATSGDGAVVFGTSGTIFRWASGSGMVDIGAGLPSGSGVQIVATDLSSDGLVAVGGFVDLGTLQGGAYRWTSGVGVEILVPFTLPDVAAFSALSADGSVIAGSSGLPDDTVAFLRTASGTTFLPELPSAGCQCGSEPSGISDDGLFVVGDSQTAPFLWSAATGTIGLGFLGGATYGEATDVSSDGSVVVGTESLPAGETAFVWTEQAGMRELRDVLVQRGVDLTGWTLTGAVGISSDGLVIAGNGTNPSGFQEAWIAFLPPQVPGIGPVGALILSALLVATSALLAATASRRMPGKHPG